MEVSTAGLQLAFERLGIVMIGKAEAIFESEKKENSPRFQLARKDMSRIHRYAHLKGTSALQRRRCLDAIDRMCEYIQDVLEREEQP